MVNFCVFSLLLPYASREPSGNIFLWWPPLPTGKLGKLTPHPPWKIRSLPWGRGGGRIFSGSTHFEFRSKPSLITVICMDPRSPNKLFATKYSFLILVDDTSFFLFISLFLSLFFWCYFTLLLIFTKIIIIIIIFFFHHNFFLFFYVRPGCSWSFRNVPACSGMFRVPGFIDALNNRGINGR